jgi:hypothetical protein
MPAGVIAPCESLSENGKGPCDQELGLWPKQLCARIQLVQNFDQQ